MKPKLTLNITAKTVEGGSDNALQAAAERKTKATETLADAWLRILAMKNSDTDAVKLREVKRAMDAGDIGRDVASAGKRFSKAEALRLYAVLAESQREQKLADLVANTPSNYRLLTDIDEVRAVVADAFNELIIAVDTETTGLDVYVDVIVGVSLTLPTADMHYYIPIQPTEDERALPSEDVLNVLKPLMESEEVGKVFHNANYDIQMFKRHGIDLRGLAWDTQTAMHVLNENEDAPVKGKQPGTYRLKDLATKYLGEPSDTFAELFGKNAKFAEVPLDIALVYGAKDTDLTWRLYEFQYAHMAKMPTVLEYYQTVEVPLLYVIVELERNGYVLDLDFAKKFGHELQTQANELHDYLITELSKYHDSDEPMNINSPQQLRPALSKHIGKELPNLDAKRTLKPLRSKHEIIDKLLEYRRITKLSGTYIDTLPTKQHPVTKRWHSRFNPMGTVTGRFSSGMDKDNSDDQSFNVQNQPKKARKMFVAPPGKVLVGADFKAQEIRCVAYLSKEPALIKAFIENKDPYANLAVEFTGLPYEEVYKTADGGDTEWRKKMKVAWLAALYGASGFTLGEWLGVPKKEAEDFMAKLWKSLPALGSWIEGNTEFVKQHGFVWMDKEQRKRRLPEAKWKREFIPYGKYDDPKYADARKHNGKIGGAIRQATNARVQGSSAIQTKVTMIRAHEECSKRDGWQLWASVHDELLFEIPSDFTREDIAVIEDVMLNSYQFGEVSNGTDIEVMTVWGEGMPVEEWFANKETEEHA